MAPSTGKLQAREIMQMAPLTHYRLSSTSADQAELISALAAAARFSATRQN